MNLKKNLLSLSLQNEIDQIYYQPFPKHGCAHKTRNQKNREIAAWRTHFDFSDSLGMSPCFFTDFFTDNSRFLQAKLILDVLCCVFTNFLFFWWFCKILILLARGFNSNAKILNPFSYKNSDLIMTR